MPNPGIQATPLSEEVGPTEPEKAAAPDQPGKVRPTYVLNIAAIPLRTVRVTSLIYRTGF
jgi:hypothetical protein